MTDSFAHLPTPHAVLIAGSGLSTALTQLVVDPTRTSYIDIPELPTPPLGVPGHAGELITGHTMDGVPVWVFAGRFHTYQGLTAADVATPVEIAAHYGAQLLITTNAAGTTRPEWNIGDIVGITDHINATGHTALVGPNFIDLTHAYDPTLLTHAALIATQAQQQNIFTNNTTWRQGVYAATPGPAYETAAEVRWLTLAGVDLVGMSTVHETVTARAHGMRVCGMSVVTNHATGIATTSHHHTAVVDAATTTAPTLAYIAEHVVNLTTAQ